MKLLVGLGNIGETYTSTRHNLGWMAVSAYMKAHQSEVFQQKARLHANVATARVGEQTVVAALPTTYMNASGRAVQALSQFYQLRPEEILVVQDELDLPVGTMRFTLGGGAGGHNGIRSIQEHLPETLLPRLRLGIGHPTTPQPVEQYVLERFSSLETPLIEQVLSQSILAIDTWLNEGIDASMQTWNGKRA